MIALHPEFDSIAATRGGANEGGAQARRLLSELLILLSTQKRKEKEVSKIVPTHSTSNEDSSNDDNDSNHPGSAIPGAKKQRLESASDTFDSFGCGLVVMAATNRLGVSTFDSKIDIDVDIDILVVNHV